MRIIQKVRRESRKALTQEVPAPDQGAQWRVQASDEADLVSISLIQPLGISSP